MMDEWGPWLFALGVILFFGWFIVGMQWNIRKGNQVLRWLREGLPLIGEKTTMRWLGSSVVELKIAKAKGAFRSAETLAVFEPRDVSLLWLYYHLRGRRDLLIFRAQLRSAPSFEIEVMNPKAWTTQGVEHDVQGKNWTRVELANASSLVAYQLGSDTGVVTQLLEQMQSNGAKLVRISVHRNVPNLEVHWLLPDPRVIPAETFFARLRDLGEATTRS